MKKPELSRDDSAPMAMAWMKTVKDGLHKGRKGGASQTRTVSEVRTRSLNKRKNRSYVKGKLNTSHDQEYDGQAITKVSAEGTLKD